ncbi:competence/damage-inducible protein A [Acaryochloris marina]|uniref:competence/damage-inducible protein A n=1 Tax=Acaryochloris marina TaxID=155978 RepID=UPI0021C43CEE|nr:competence/damage-inducible protein A [Acaryochloris marina]BDM81724.1 CinA-like protein [Acaryochloris marina MBIC10699]
MSRSAEVICVGTELLLGEVLNSNAQFLGQELARLGIAHFHQTVVGDNPTRIKRAIALACQRSQLLIFTGGLGPTPDDLTTETLADFFQAPLVNHPEILEDIARKFAQRNRVPSPSNDKQALLPDGAQILPNPIGSAPGIIWHPRPELTIFTFPGVPKEFHRMWQETAVPYLQSTGWVTAQIYSRVLRFWGIPESTLADQVAPLLALTNPTVAPYASKGQARLRISTRATSQETAHQVIAPIEQQIRQICGLHCFGGDDETLESVVGKLLQQRGETLAVAESCTGGGLGQRITGVSGSSTYFLGGVISYTNAAKRDLLKVNTADLEQYGAVSAIVAEQMAAGVRSQLHSTWGISITGIAGPDGGSETKPVGLVYIGLSGPQGTQSFEYQISPLRGRDWIRQMSTSHALDRLRRQLLADES